MRTFHLKPRSLILLAVALLLLSGCKNSRNRSIEKTGFYFDTVIKITLYGTENEDLLEQCFALCDKYEQMFSRTIETSDIYRINHAGGQPTEVSAETAKLLEKALYYSELSGGAFDLTIAPLTNLWDFKKETPSLPSDAQIAEAKSHVGYQNVLLEGFTVTLTDPDSAIDLGGIAKGYIADKIKQHLKEQGVKHAMINLGGNVLPLGGKPDGTNFHIGIRKPFDKTNTPIATVSTKDQSVVSSGVYERYFELDGIRYHHILNPKTGYPYENDLLGVTIISDSSADGDALSTTCFALGLEKGMAFIERIDGAEALFITKDYEIYDTRT